MSIRRAFVVVVVSMVLLGGPPTSAQGAGDTYTLELFGGAWQPGADYLDDGQALGFRLGREIDVHNSFSASLTYLSGDILPASTDRFDLELIAPVSYEVFALDINQKLRCNPDGKVHPFVTAGFGWAWGSETVKEPAADSTEALMQTVLPRSSFTLNGGAGLDLDLGERFLLNLLVRGRWFRGREYGSVDAEAVLGIAIEL